jgi:hypothetical protein
MGPIVTWVTLRGGAPADTAPKEQRVLIPSVLHILDKLQSGAKVSATNAAEGFQSLFGKELASLPDPMIGRAREEQKESAGVARPKPHEFPPRIGTPQRGVEEFIKTLEEVEKVERPPILNLFE